MVAISDLGTKQGIAMGLLESFLGTSGELTLGAIPLEAIPMNNIIYIIGLIVVALAILAFLGQR